MAVRLLRTFFGRLCLALTFLLALALALAARSGAQVGLYRDGRLVDALTTDVLPTGTRSADPGAGASASSILPSPIAPPQVSPQTRERNAAFAVAGRRAMKMRELLRRMDASPQRRGPAYRHRLQRLLRLFLATENRMRNALNDVGQRILALGLERTVYDRHLETVETFEKGLAEVVVAVSAVIRGERQAVPRALEVMERLTFRDQPPILSAESGSDGDERRAPVVTREHRPAGGAPAYAAAALPAPPPPGPGDLAATVDVQLTPEIQNQAAALGNSPVAIYEFVRNRVRFQPYLGSRKGSAETLAQLRGNDTDQASLLIALLRAAGVPCRYLRGAVTLEPERVMNWLGVDDALTAASILATEGLDGVAVAFGPDIVAIEFTHVWVEALVPYANYRGVPNDAAGKIWVPLDPSFKGLTINPGGDVLSAMGFNADAFVADYISTFHAPSPLEKLDQDVQAYLDAQGEGQTLADVERTAEIVPQALGVLPLDLPYQVLAITDRLSALEDSKRYKVRFHLFDGSTDFIDYTASLPELMGKQLTIEYVGATPTDQATIDGFGGIYDTPPNLVNVKPVLKLDAVAVATGASGIGMGRVHSADMVFMQPDGAPNSKPLIHNQIIAGNGQAIGLDTFLDVNDPFTSSTDDSGETTSTPDAFLGSVLHLTALDFLSRVDRGLEKAERLMHVVTTQDVSEAIVLNTIAVTLSFGVPVGFEWTGLAVDADRRVVAVFAANGDSSQSRPYKVLTGANGSIMENRVFEDVFDQEAVSTIKILELASDAGIPICAITTSIAANCPGMTHPANITSAINAALALGHRVTIPRNPITVGLWSGTGYIDMNPVTGAAVYDISGGISGGVQSSAGGATVQRWFKKLPCLALLVETEVIDPPHDSPDPQAIFCADDEPITFTVHVDLTCERPADSQSLDLMYSTRKTKMEIVKEFGAGDYFIRAKVLNAFRSVAMPRKLTLATLDLITPAGDPVTAPVTSGDGQNEFTFSSANPGKLEIHFKASMTPNDASVLNTLKDKVRFTVEPIGDSMESWDPANPAGFARVDGNFLVATDTFTGLPQNNSDFGLKKATVRCNATEQKEAKLEVFYPRLATNHPSSDLAATTADNNGRGNSTRAPNWFFYWNQAVGDPDALFDSTMAGPDGETPALLHHPRDAAHAIDGQTHSYSGPVGRVLIGSSAQETETSPFGFIDGIDKFEHVLLHENHHVRQVIDFSAVIGRALTESSAASSSNWSFNTTFSPRGTGPYNHFDPSPPHNDLDADHDDVPNDGTDVAPAADTGQIEDDAENAAAVTNDQRASLDWADPGKQHKALKDDSD